MKRLIAFARKRKLNSQRTKVDGKQQFTIFDGLFESKLSSHELRMERLKDEAVSLIGAGIASSEWTCTIAIFHIISDRCVFQRLRDELFGAIPDPRRIPSWNELEKLPFHMACVEESKLAILI